MLQFIETVNSAVNNFIWGVPAMVCIFTTSQALRASSPGRGASGEEMGLYDMPRPPLGRRGGITQR